MIIFAILDRDSIHRLKPGVFLVNTARSSLIDEVGVLEGLIEGRIAGLALDVYGRELPDTGPLLTHDRVIATPHIGGYATESVPRTTFVAVENLVKYFERK